MGIIDDIVSTFTATFKAIVRFFVDPLGIGDQLTDVPGEEESQQKSNELIQNLAGGIFDTAEDDVLRPFDSADQVTPDNVEQLRTAVPVGEGEIPGVPEDFGERQIKALSQLKLDAVVDRPGRQQIIELKSRVRVGALGQVLAYDVLLGELADEPTESERVAVGFRAHPDLSPVARLLNVRLHTVPEADPSGATRRFNRDRQDI